MTVVTDGVVECRNVKGDLYGVERLKEVVALDELDQPRLLGRGVVEDVQAHGQDARDDDVTVVVFGRLPST